MKEVWHKTNMVKQLKQILQANLQMTVNEDKLDQVLHAAKNQLHGLQHPLSPASSHSMSLPNRNHRNFAQLMKTLPVGPIQTNNEYADANISVNETLALGTKLDRKRTSSFSTRWD